MNALLFLWYYAGLNLFNFLLAFSLTLLNRFELGLVLYCSFGYLVSILGYQHLYKNHYFLLYNSGWRKSKLFAWVWVCNCLLAMVMNVIF